MFTVLKQYSYLFPLRPAFLLWRPSFLFVFVFSIVNDTELTLEVDVESCLFSGGNHLPLLGPSRRLMSELDVVRGLAGNGGSEFLLGPAAAFLCLRKVS